MYLRDGRVFQDDRGDVMKTGRRVVRWRAKERRAFIALGVGTRVEEICSDIVDRQNPMNIRDESAADGQSMTQEGIGGLDTP